MTRGRPAMSAGRRFAGDTVVVTGAASGIGASVASCFADEGADVVLVDLDDAGIRAHADLLGTRHARQRFEPCALDISDDDALAGAVQRLADRNGPVDHLVNCAASFVAGGLDATAGQWSRSLMVNVAGTARIGAEVAKRMSSGGSIVNISSISAHVAQPDRWTYNATKAAILALTRCQALDLAPRAIRVNAVSPGWIWTPEVLRAAGGDRAAHEREWGDYHMLRRLGEPEEVARAVLFLCSDDASFITATELFVDGGYHAVSGEGLGETSRFAGTS